MTDVRRDRRRRPLRRRADRDAAGPQGLPGAGRRPGDVPERHPLDAHDPRPRQSPRCAAGGCSTRWSPPAARPSRRTRSTSDRSRSPARRAPPTAARPATRRAEPSSTRSSSTPPPTPAPRCASASPSTRSSSRTARSSASAATARTARPVIERARVVIGADGRNSHVAKAVRAEQYNEKPMLQWGYYTYWSDLPVDGFEIVIRPDRGWAALPTNDGLTMLVVGLAVRRVDRLQGRRRGQLPQDARARARVRRARPRRATRGAVLRRVRPQLLPQAVRPGLGARRRRRLHQGPDHRAGHQRRVPRRRAVRRRARRRRSAARARSTTRCRPTSGPATPTRCRSTSSRPSWRRSRRRPRRCSSCSAPCTATRTRWTPS